MKAVKLAPRTPISIQTVNNVLSGLYSPLELGFQCEGRMKVDRMTMAEVCERCWWLAVHPEVLTQPGNNTALMMVVEGSLNETIELKFTHESEGFDPFCVLSDEDFMLSLGETDNLKARAWRTRVMVNMMEDQTFH